MEEKENEFQKKWNENFNKEIKNICFYFQKKPEEITEFIEFLWKKLKFNNLDQYKDKYLQYKKNQKNSFFLKVFYIFFLKKHI